MLPAVLVAGALSPEFAAAATAFGAMTLRYGPRIVSCLPRLFNAISEEMPYLPNALDRAGKLVTTGTAAAVAVIASEAGKKPGSPQENPATAPAAASPPLPLPPTR